MTNSSEPPQYRMASLDQKRAQVAARNIMEAGPGTPWEGRGTLGRISAFFKTIAMSMFHPIQLTTLMRRSEISSDVTFFALSCGSLWGIAMAIDSWFRLGPIKAALLYGPGYPMKQSALGVTGNELRYDVDMNWYWISTAIVAAAIIAATWAGLKLASLVYEKLISHDMPQRAPAVLFFNVLGYCLGPSLLALIPWYGWLAAALWIMINWLAVGKARLGAKAAASIIATVLTSIVIFAAGFGVYYLGRVAIQYFSLTDLRV